jgi:nucleoside-diphosphate-sugar epimerase
MVEAVCMLMRSELDGPVNIGALEYVTVDELVATVIEVSGRRIGIRHVDGPVGVQSRNFSNARIHSLGWRAQVSLKEGIGRTYPWIAEQVRAAGEPDRDPPSASAG